MGKMDPADNPQNAHIKTTEKMAISCSNQPEHGTILYNSHFSSHFPVKLLPTISNFPFLVLKLALFPPLFPIPSGPRCKGTMPSWCVATSSNRCASSKEGLGAWRFQKFDADIKGYSTLILLYSRYIYIYHD
jgi:hypothetical protein